MEYLLSGLIGVLVGAVIASGIILYVFQRRADRDLIERRLRALLVYHDSLGDLVGTLGDERAPDPKVLDQAWKNVALFCREFRVTGWIFPDADREPLARVVTELERALNARKLNGGASSVPRLLDRSSEIDRLLRRAMKNQVAEYRRFRFLPSFVSAPREKRSSTPR